MDWAIVTLFFIIVVSTIMFITELFSVDKIAVLVMISLLATGLVTGEEAISGFSNPAVITIMSLMIIAAALEHNGSIGLLADAMMPIFSFSLKFSLPLVMLLVGGFSAFISTTAVVILFVKIMPDLAIRYDLKLEKYMMPLSFAGILGGSCTLMGTSTNLIVNQIAIERGLPGFSFFQVSQLAGILLIAGIVITSIGSIFFLRKSHRASDHPVPQKRYISILKILAGNPIIGNTYKSTNIYKDSNSTLLQIRRSSRIIKHPSYWLKFKEGDVIVVSTILDKTLSLNLDEYYELIPEDQANNEPHPTGKVLEILVLPDSKLISKNFSDISSSDLNGALPIAINKHRNIFKPTDRFIENKLSRVRVDPGDTILVQLDELTEDSWSLNDNSQILNHMDASKINQNKKYLSLLILACIIGLASSGFATILESSLLGLGLLLITQCVTLEHAYRSVNWQIIFLLAGLLPLGVAMTNTGSDQFLSNILLEFLQDFSPTIIISLLFLITMIISGVISNNATAIIITPIAISLAHGLGLNPLSFIVTVMLAANFSFFTPIGYQTNTIIYGMGIYRFRDFVFLGGVLSFFLWIICSCLIPVYFPFT